MDCALLVRLGDRNRSVPLSLNELHRCLALSVVMHGWGSLVTLLGSNSTVANNHIDSANWITRQHTANITVAGRERQLDHPAAYGQYHRRRHQPEDPPQHALHRHGQDDRLHHLRR